MNTPFAKVGTTLQGQAGDTITVPVFAYIGDAEDVAEGVEVTATKLTATSAQFTIKKAMKAVTLTDEAVFSGYGDPVGEANGQLAKAIASKADNDAMDILTTEYNASTAPQGVQKIYAPSTASILSYAHLVNAVDLFEEEVQSVKVVFVHPKQVTQLRLDTNFISADKYNNEVMMKGEIGMVAGCRVVPSKRVKTSGSGSSALYLNPIVKLTSDSETEDERKSITEDMITVADKIEEAHINNQKFISKTITKFIIGGLAIVAAIGAAIGVSSQFSNSELPQLNDEDDDEN